ncbi:MAG: glycosyltransferase family 2 protein [Candidatus Omnitrophota bacterium]
MITVIFPVFNEQGNLQALYERLCTAISKMNPQDFEFIFVDDCSTDHSPEILKELRNKDPRIKIIRFARNCGSHAALNAGLAYAHGDCAIVLGADLQDPPEIIKDLLDARKDNVKIVWGVRTKRKGESSTTKLCAGLYYALMNWLTNVKVPPSGADVFLIDRVVIEALKKVPEKHSSIFMTLAWLGFPQASIFYVKEARHKGQSKWTLGKKIKLTIDSLLSFSDIPIRYMSVIGFCTALLGFIYAAYVLWCFLYGAPVEGWSSLIVAVLVIGGIQMMMLGILGEYLWRTYDESRKRPPYVIEYTIE